MTNTDTHTDLATTLAAAVDAVPATTWQITVAGETFYTSQLRMTPEVAEIQALLGLASWLDITPAEVDHLMACVFVYLKRSMTAEAAKELCAALTPANLTARIVTLTDAIQK